MWSSFYMNKLIYHLLFENHDHDTQKEGPYEYAQQYTKGNNHCKALRRGPTITEQGLPQATTLFWKHTLHL